MTRPALPPVAPKERADEATGTRPKQTLTEGLQISPLDDASEGEETPTRRWLVVPRRPSVGPSPRDPEHAEKPAVNKTRGSDS